MQLILFVFHNYLCNVRLRTLQYQVVRYPGEKRWPAVDRIGRRVGTLDAARRLLGMMGLERRFEGVTIRVRRTTRLRALADIGAPPSYKRAPSGRGSKG
jgi:hypothetical protein